MQRQTPSAQIPIAQPESRQSARQVFWLQLLGVFSFSELTCNTLAPVINTVNAKSLNIIRFIVILLELYIKVAKEYR